MPLAQSRGEVGEGVTFRERRHQDTVVQSSVGPKSGRSSRILRAVLHAVSLVSQDSCRAQVDTTSNADSERSTVAGRRHDLRIGRLDAFMLVMARQTTV